MKRCTGEGGSEASLSSPFSLRTPQARQKMKEGERKRERKREKRQFRYWSMEKEMELESGRNQRCLARIWSDLTDSYLLICFCSLPSSSAEEVYRWSTWNGGKVDSLMEWTRRLSGTKMKLKLKVNDGGCCDDGYDNEEEGKIRINV